MGRSTPVQHGVHTCTVLIWAPSKASSLGMSSSLVLFFTPDLSLNVVHWKELQTKNLSSLLKWMYYIVRIYLHRLFPRMTFMKSRADILNVRYRRRHCTLWFKRNKRYATSHVYFWPELYSEKFSRKEKGIFPGMGRWGEGWKEGRKEVWKSLCVDECKLRCNQEKTEALKLLALKR